MRSCADKLLWKKNCWPICRVSANRPAVCGTIGIRTRPRWAPWVLLIEIYLTQEHLRCRDRRSEILEELTIRWGAVQKGTSPCSIVHCLDILPQKNHQSVLLKLRGRGWATKALEEIILDLLHLQISNSCSFIHLTDRISLRVIIKHHHLETGRKVVVAAPAPDQSQDPWAIMLVIEAQVSDHYRLVPHPKDIQCVAPI